MSTLSTLTYKCEGGLECSHIIPEDVYSRLNEWSNDREADLFICHEDCVGDCVVLKHEGVWCVVAENPEPDITSPKASANYEEWRANGIKLAARLQTLYEDKVTVHWNETPAKARYFITIGVNMEGDVIRLLDFAKEQGII